MVAGRVYLANAFSLGMLSLPRGVGVELCVEELDLEHWVEAVTHHLARGELECAIGHVSTVELARRLISMAPWRWEGREVELNCERKMVTLQRGDTLYVLQPRVRLPEGKVLDYDEIVQLLREGKVGFYTVHYGPC